MTRHFHDLDLDINLDETLRERVDVNETRVTSASETPEFGDQTNVSLRDWLVGIGTDDAAGNGTEETDTGSEGVDWGDVLAGGDDLRGWRLTHRTIPAMALYFGLALKLLRI